MSQTSGPAGYPDFGRYEQHAASLLLLDKAVAFPVDVVVGPVYVGSLAALSVNLSVDTPPVAAQCNIAYFDDQAATKQTGFRRVIVNGVNVAVSVSSVLGNWARFDIVSDTHPAGIKRWTTIQGFTWRPFASDLLPTTKLVTHQFPAVGAGLTQTFELTHTCNSRATLTYECNNDKMGVQLQQYDVAVAAWRPVMLLASTAGAFGGTVEGYVEAVPTRFLVANSNAAASLVNVILVYGE